MPPEGRMTPQQFRSLLRAYGAVSRRPFGAMGSYSEGMPPPELTTMRDGRPWPAKDLWVVGPGYERVAEIKPRAPFPEVGYVFYVPRNGAVEFVEMLSNSRLLSNDIGD